MKLQHNCRTDSFKGRLDLLQSTAPAKRNRFGYALAMALVVGLGLLWRSSWLNLPKIPRKYGGDMLWALLVFLGFGFLFPGLSMRFTALLAMMFATLIEFSQIYHAPWIDSLRATWLGSLVLGSVFNWPDFAAYATGIVLGTVLEYWSSNWPSSRNKSANMKSEKDPTDALKEV